MRYTELGSTGLEVSRICFGTWSFGGDWGAADRDAAVSAVRTSRELGVNFFDTARGYGFGASESVLRDGLDLHRSSAREGVVVVTKGGLRQVGDKFVHDNSPHWLRSGLEASLRDLGTDYVDGFLVHFPDPGVPADSVAQTLTGILDAGLARHVGLSNHSALQIDEMSRLVPIMLVEPQFHLFQREGSVELAEVAERLGLGVFSYGTLVHGLLTGKYRTVPEFPEGDWRAASSIFKGEAFARNVAIVEELRPVAESQGLSLAELAVAWTVAQRAIDSAIVGFRNPSQVTSLIGGASAELDEQTLARIEEITRDHVPVKGAAPSGIW